MASHLCPWWFGYLLVNPLRRLRQDPRRLLGPFVRDGMVVLEPGCGMGFFTLEAARMVGPDGRVVAVDVQPRMLAGLERRAARAGLAARVERRLVGADGMGLSDLAGLVDLVFAFYMVHEVNDPAGFFAELVPTLKPDGRVLVVEPRWHVSADDFAAGLEAAARAGLTVVDHPELGRDRTALLALAEV